MYVISFYKNPFTHSRGDTLDEIDFDLLKKAAKGISLCVGNLAGTRNE